MAEERVLQGRGARDCAIAAAPARAPTTWRTRLMSRVGGVAPKGEVLWYRHSHGWLAHVIRSEGGRARCGGAIRGRCYSKRRQYISRLARTAAWLACYRPQIRHNLWTPGLLLCTPYVRYIRYSLCTRTRTTSAHIWVLGEGLVLTYEYTRGGVPYTYIVLVGNVLATPGKPNEQFMLFSYNL